MARNSNKPALSAAQRRFLRKLLADPSYRPRRATTKMTQDALERRGCLRVQGTTLTPLWNPDTEAWTS